MADSFLKSVRIVYTVDIARLQVGKDTPNGSAANDYFLFPALLIHTVKNCY